MKRNKGTVKESNEMVKKKKRNKKALNMPKIKCKTTEKKERVRHKAHHLINSKL